VSSHAPTNVQPALDRARALAWTSYLRVGAIVGVVLIHVAGLSFVREDLQGTLAWALGGALAYGSRWAVIVFVMVSGALLLTPPKDPDPGRFFRRRLGKVGIPLIVWHAVYIPLSAVRWDLTPGELLANVLEGRSYTALYFFWLILGLYAVTPLLWPAVASLRPRALAAAGAALAALPALDVVLRGLVALLRDEPRVLPEPTLVTQFVPYVGYFVLGYALRGVVLRGARLAALAAVLAGLLAQMVWQALAVEAVGDATESGSTGLLPVLVPLSYQGAVVGLSAVAVYLLARGVAHPGSRWAAPARAARVRRLGDLTFGVFAVHLLVFWLLAQLPGLDVEEGASSVPGVVLLSAVVVVVSFGVAWLLSRTPLLRRAV
jgi:surface polysaccharide O-acyltransferase-like enzyme